MDLDAGTVSDRSADAWPSSGRVPRVVPSPPRSALVGGGIFAENGSHFLDFVRILATNLVLLNHALSVFGFGPHIDCGGLGVVLFFLLSGFLISIAGQRRLRRTENQFAGFLIDRCSRIFVPFIPAVVLVAFVNVIFSLSQRGQVGVNRGPVAFAANLLLLNDYPVLQAASHVVSVKAIFPRSYNAAEPFWTIPIEFWTYVVFAIFLFVFVRRERVRWFVTLPLLAIAAPVFLWNSFAGGSGDLTLIWILGAAFGAVWTAALASSPAKARLGALLLGFGALGLAGRILKAGYDAYEFQQDIFIAAMLFGIFMLVSTIDLRAGLLGRVLTLLASYSYSVYLVHNTVLVVFQEKLSDSLGKATPVVAMGAAHAVAYAFYLLFESHYHAVGRWLKRRFLRAVPG